MRQSLQEFCALSIASCSSSIGPREEAGAVGSRSINRQGYRGFLGLQVAAAVAGMQDRGKDIWEDQAALEFLQQGQHRIGTFSGISS